MPDIPQTIEKAADHQKALEPRITDLATEIWATDLPVPARIQIAFNLAAILIAKITTRFVKDEFSASLYEAVQNAPSPSPTTGLPSQKEQET